jgi:hypothetical protein
MLEARISRTSATNRSQAFRVDSQPFLSGTALVFGKQESPQLMPQEIPMNVITIGRRVVTVEQIALVEPFDAAANPEFKPEKDFKTRVVLLNRDTVLAEVAPKEFAEAHGLRMLVEDNVALNPSIVFKVETFTPTESFKPSKPYLTRIKWRDGEGNEQSKLLVTGPQTVLAEILGRKAEEPASPKQAPKRPARGRRGRLVDALRTR